MIVPDTDAWLYELLSADPELAGMVENRIFAYVAPALAVYPLVIFAFQGGSDVYASGKARVMSHLEYQVKAVCEGATYTGIVAIADRLDALLHGASGATATVRVMSCIRQAPLAYPEITDDGMQYRHLGGIYRLQVQPA